MKFFISSESLLICPSHIIFIFLFFKHWVKLTGLTEDTQNYYPMTVQVKPTKTQPFYAAEVKLLDGAFNESQDAKAKHLLSLDPDRLLSPFITESGLQPRVPAYQGWETRPLPGDGRLITGPDQPWRIPGTKHGPEAIVTRYILVRDLQSGSKNLLKASRILKKSEFSKNNL